MPRVTDKSSDLTAMVLIDLIRWIWKAWKERLFMSRVTDKSSDLTAMGGLDELRKLNGSPKHGMARISICFGAPQHCKGDKDRYFATLTGGLAEAARHRAVTKSEHLWKVFLDGAEDMHKADKYNEYFVDWLPREAEDPQ